ncbi:hypothetical protein Tco_0242995 [Tanacetum coccineum]
MTGLPGDSKGQTETEVSKNSKGCLPKTNISLSASLPMQRSQVILLKNQACNKIRSSSRETMMNNPLTRSQVAHAEEPPTSFDELNDTSFRCLAFVLNRLLKFQIVSRISGWDALQPASKALAKVLRN